MTEETPERANKVSLAPLSPEEALRALLAVKPEDPDGTSDENRDGKKDPAHEGPGE